MIILNGVTKHYKTKDGYRIVLDNVSMELPTDRQVGILGRNGAGKSTFLRMISGVEMPDSGSIISTVNLSWPLGFSGGLHPELTGRENLRFAARVFGVDIDYVELFCEDFCELDVYMDMPIKTYSSGMRAKLAFGLSLSMNFDCYLVDEVTSVGDKWFREKAQAAFNERKALSGLLMVSHNPATIRSYCDIGLVLCDGHLTLYEDLDEAIAAYDEKV